MSVRPKALGPCSAGSVDGVVGWNNSAEWQDGVKLNVGDGAPVEFECGTGWVGLGWGAVECAEDIELVVAEVDGGGVVGLKGRAGLGAEPGGGGDEEKQKDCQA
jgi:hypothetical protein